MVQAPSNDPMAKTRKRKAHAPLPLMNQSAAARLIGVSRPTVVAMVARGELDSEQHAGFLLVTRESAERAKAKRDAQSAAA